MKIKVLVSQNFYSFLYDFMEMLNNQENFVLNANNDNISISDMKISYIYDNFGLISKLLKFQYSIDEANFHEMIFCL